MNGCRDVEQKHAKPRGPDSDVVVLATLAAVARLRSRELLPTLQYQFLTVWHRVAGA